jgi:hypothetical protein
MVCKFQNALQARTGHNMVKSRSPNPPSTWLIFLCACNPRFLAELASILLLAFFLFALVAVLSQCLCSDSPHLSINSSQSNFSATSILPNSYLFWAGKRLLVTCNYCTVLKEKNRNRKSTTCAICWLKSVIHEEKCREQENHNVGRSPT